jgi:hypothetical protein
MAHHQEDQVKRLPWIAAGILIVAALLAIFLHPTQLRTIIPGELWGDLAHPLGRPAPTPSPAAPVTPGQAVYVVEQVSPIVAGDSLVEALGIESPRGRFRTVLPRGTKVPVGRIVTFGTGADNQQEVRLHILRGNSEVTAEGHSLGWIRIAGLPPRPRGQTRISIAFQVVDGAIVLAAQNADDGKPFAIGGSEPPPGFER